VRKPQTLHAIAGELNLIPGRSENLLERDLEMTVIVNQKDRQHMNKFPRFERSVLASHIKFRLLVEA